MEMNGRSFISGLFAKRTGWWTRLSRSTLMWVPLTRGDNSWLLFSFPLFTFCFLSLLGRDFFWSNFFGSGWGDTVQSETVIQFPHDPHSPMVNPRRGFRTPRLRCQIRSIPSRTPHFWSNFLFSLEGKGGYGWKIIHDRPFAFRA